MTATLKKPSAKQYREAERDTLASYMPRTYPCGKCKWPVVDGYVCGYCGDNNPYHDKKGRNVRDWK